MIVFDVLQKEVKITRARSCVDQRGARVRGAWDCIEQVVTDHRVR
jgi:hypothetical protein